MAEHVDYLSHFHITGLAAPKEVSPDGVTGAYTFKCFLLFDQPLRKTLRVRLIVDGTDTELKSPNSVLTLAPGKSVYAIGVEVKKNTGNRFRLVVVAGNRGQRDWEQSPRITLT